MNNKLTQKQKTGVAITFAIVVVLMIFTWIFCMNYGKNDGPAVQDVVEVTSETELVAEIVPEETEKPIIVTEPAVTSIAEPAETTVATEVIEEPVITDVIVPEVEIISEPCSPDTGDKSPFKIILSLLAIASASLIAIKELRKKGK